MLVRAFFVEVEKIQIPFSNQKGQSLVEFAIILPVVLIILIGMLEFGLILNAYLSINNCSREGARLGVVGGSDNEIENLIKSISPNLNTDKLSVSINPSQAYRKRGESLTVTVEYSYDVITPIISIIINEEINLKIQTTMRIE